MSVTPYPVRDIPRGVVVGYVHALRMRDWVAVCEQCCNELFDTTRPATENRLRMHVRRVHWTRP